MKIYNKNIFFTLLIIVINHFNYSAQVIDWGFTIDTKVFNEKQKVLTDVNNNIYTCGFFENTSNFDPLGIGHIQNYIYSGSTSQTYRGGDGYVAKYDSNGVRIWSAFFEGVAGGNQDDWIQDMYVDARCNLYVAGIYDVGVNLTTDIDTLQFTLPSNYYKGAVVIKFDSLGNYINSFQINGCESTIRLTVDSLSNIYVGGKFADVVDVDPSPSIFELYDTFGYDGDGFIAKYDSAGQYVWGRNINGVSCAIADLEIDQSNKLWAAINVGYKVHLDTSSSNSLINSNNSDIVLASYNTLNGAFNSFFKITGEGEQYVNDIEVDNSNDIVIGGSIYGETDVDPSVDTLLRVSGDTDGQIFIGKYTNVGDYIWDINIGGGYSDGVSSIYVDKFNNIFAGGHTNLKIDFDPSACDAKHNSDYNENLFVAKYSSNGNYLGSMAIGYVGFPYNHEAVTYDVTMDMHQNIIMTGAVENSVDFDPSSQEYILYGGNGSTFVSKYKKSSFRNSYNCFKGCLGDSVQINGQYYTSDTVLIDSLLTFDSCDSLSIYTVDISPIYHFEYDYTYCEGDSFFVDGSWRDTALVHFDTLITDNLCKYNKWSFFIEQTFDTVVEVSICTGDSIFLQGEYRKQAGLYIDTMVSVNWCDSITRTILTINPECFAISYNLCFGDSLFWAGNYISSNGVYIDSLTSSTGQDSILNMTLVVEPDYFVLSSNYAPQICYGDSLLIYGEYQSNTGEYYDTLQSVNGCDSLAMTRLVVMPLDTIRYNAVYLCYGDSVQINNSYIDTTTYLFDSLYNNQGCLFIVAREIIFSPSTPIIDTIYICEGDSVIINGDYYSSPESFSDTLTTQIGCDSIIQTYLLYYEPDTTVTINNDSIISNSTEGSYQWIDCSNNFDLINGENSQLFQPNYEGSYAVILTFGSCADTSNCYSISPVGFVENNFEQNIAVFPNPTDGFLSIDMGEAYHSLDVTMSSNDGKVIFKKNYKERRFIELKIEEPAGIYFFVVSSGGKKAVIKVIKE